MTTLSIYFSSYCGYCIINYLTWKMNKMKKGTTAVIAVAADIANLIPFGDVYFGEGTDPDGDEIVVFVPGTECREYLDKVVKTVCSFTYPTFRKYFTKALYTNHN